MKRLLFLTIAFAATAAAASARTTDWARFDRYAAADSAVRTDSVRPTAVLFGNSITDFWASMRPEFLERNSMAGRGISGQTTYQMLSRFRRDVVELQPRCVVINAAINDIAENTHPYNEDMTMGNIMSMVEIARANGIRVILTSVLPAGFIYWNRDITDVPAKIARLNSRIAAYAASQNIPYVNYHPSMLADDGRSINPAYSDDGLHPNAAGYEVMESLLLPFVQREASR